MRSKINRKLVWKYFEKNIYVAHRGLFDPSTERQENSLPAFRYAVEKGYGCELDVQLTKDKKLVVFHDEDLKRMCGVDKLVRECTYEELQNYMLGKSWETIPLFKEVLEAVSGKIPLIVEVKGEGDWKTATEMTAQHLDMYPGPYVVESFHPMVVAWFRFHRPQMVRGLLSCNYAEDTPKLNPLHEKCMTHMVFRFLGKPDFIAYDHRYPNMRPLPALRRKGKVKMVTWTVKSQEQLEACREYFEFYIFDSFIPE